jgi:cytochrome P450
MNDPFGLCTPEFQADPYPMLARLRREAPIYFSEPWEAWLVTRHADVHAGFRDERLSADRAAAFARHVPAALADEVAPLVNNVRRWALFIDPPAHKRVRALLNRAFSPRLINGLRPRIVAIVNQLLDASNGHDQFDLVQLLAVPLPVLVIGELMGLPPEDRERLKTWSDDLAALLGAATPTLPLLRGAVRAIVELEAYFREHIAERRRTPREDLLTALVASEADGAILDEQELVATAAMMLFGGHETTTHLIGNGVHALARHPGQWRRLHAEPALAPSAVEELLRYDSPVQRMGRVVKTELVLHGQRLGAGQRVFLMLGAANRDPDVFAAPDELDLERADNKHLAFGWGAHYCVGAALGRLEAELVLAELARRFVTLTLDGETPPHLHNATVRGLSALPISVTR